jgi:hypothetical protein
MNKVALIVSISIMVGSSMAYAFCGNAVTGNMQCIPGKTNPDNNGCIQPTTTNQTCTGAKTYVCSSTSVNCTYPLLVWNPDTQTCNNGSMPNPQLQAFASTPNGTQCGG